MTPAADEVERLNVSHRNYWRTLGRHHALCAQLGFTGMAYPPEYMQRFCQEARNEYEAGKNEVAVEVDAAHLSQEGAKGEG